MHGYNMLEKIKFTVVGFGHIGKRHCEMIKRNSYAKLLAVADIDNNLQKEAEETYNIPFYNSLESLLENQEDTDVICICTPNGLHAEQALKVLKSKKNVVIEKPLGLTKLECEKVIHQSLAVSKKVFCVMQNRYSPPSAWLKEVMDKKLLGNIYMVQVNCYWNRDERYYKEKGWKGKHNLDGGTLFTQFSHFVDIMYWLFGDISNISARFADFNHAELTDFEDSGIVTFDFNNGGMGSFNYSTSVYNSNLESSITIIGEKGSIKVGGQYMDEVLHCNIKGYTMPTLPEANPANDYGAYKGSAANHNFVIDNVIQTLLGSSSMTTNALEGLKVVDIIERIYNIKNKSFRK